MISFKRKQYIVDKKFQLRTAFTGIGFIFAVVAILTAVIGINVLDVNNKISRIVEIEDNIVQAVTVPNPEMSDENQMFSIKMARDHDANMKTLRKMIDTNQLLMWIIVVVVFVQGFILFFLLIVQTHRIVGPLYVMSMYMRQIIEGKYPEYIRPLRKKDLFKDFYDLFVQMIDTVKKGKVK